MYWPLGTARAYAVLPPSFTASLTHDGLPLSPLSPSSSASHRNPLHSSQASSQQLLSPRSHTSPENSLALSTTTPSNESIADAQRSPVTPRTPHVASIDRELLTGDDPDDDDDTHDLDPTGKTTTLDLVRKNQSILALQASRSGHIFATLTSSSITVWQSRPTVILASITRSPASLRQYGRNTNLCLRADSAILVVLTDLGYLVTYSMATDPENRVYKAQFSEYAHVQRRRQFAATAGLANAVPADQFFWGPGEASGVRDVSLRFRMIIKIDAGVFSVLALEDELIVATKKPPAVQCIRWTPDATGKQTRTELVTRMEWMHGKSPTQSITSMTYDRPMNLATWVTSDGHVYAVQRLTDADAPRKASSTASSTKTPNTPSSTPGPDDSKPRETDPLPTPDPIINQTVAPPSPSKQPSSTSSSTSTLAPPHADTTTTSSTSTPPSKPPPRKLFNGYMVHNARDPATASPALCAVVNARFSLIAVGCADGIIRVYLVKDYAGTIPLSHTHKLELSSTTTSQTLGAITLLSYSPDGYCLFAGFEHGWACWSVFGQKPTGHSFASHPVLAESMGDAWLSGIHQAVWLGNAAEVVVARPRCDRVWVVEMVRHAAVSNHNTINLFRPVLHSSSRVGVFRGTSLATANNQALASLEPALWDWIQIPAAYLAHQWPVRMTSISPDGRYLALAGRRGLIHYSMASGRWRTFHDELGENEFQVRGGMCWYKHVLVAAVEVPRSVYELRLYARDADLDVGSALWTQAMPSPIVLITNSGDEDSLLVYTYDNILYHFLLTPVANRLRLVQVGQIAFHGIIRSPARVRGISWVLPEGQRTDGDPSRDVAVATVLLLMDGKLVALQPSMDAQGATKYDMRVLAHNVEFFVHMHDNPFLQEADSPGLVKPPEGSPSQGPASASGGQDKTFLSPSSTTSHIISPVGQEDVSWLSTATVVGSGLRDSFWFMEGNSLRVWSDFRDVMQAITQTSSVYSVASTSISSGKGPVGAREKEEAANTSDEQTGDSSTLSQKKTTFVSSIDDAHPSMVDGKDAGNRRPDVSRSDSLVSSTAQELPATIDIELECQPLTVQFDRGLVAGLTTTLEQKGEVGLSVFHTSLRVSLVLPMLLRAFLAQDRQTEALLLTYSYRHVEYLPWVLELLLHRVLEEEVETHDHLSSSPARKSAPKSGSLHTVDADALDAVSPGTTLVHPDVHLSPSSIPTPRPSEQSLLCRTLRMLSHFPEYYDVILQCSRKTEVEHWKTLFQYLPPIHDLFEEILHAAAASPPTMSTSPRGPTIQTASGYLLILHTLAPETSVLQPSSRVLRMAMKAEKWDLCRELARFLRNMDETGDILQQVMALAEGQPGHS